MKSANQLIAQAHNNITTADQPEKRAGDDFAAKIINDLVRSIFANYPAWRTSFADYQNPEKLAKGVDLMKKNWVKAFMESGICTHEQIAEGMKKVRKDTSDFLPGVGKFIEWCKPDPADYNLPSLSDAWSECCHNSHQPVKHKWTHNIIYQAGRQVGWYELRSASSKDQIAQNKASFVWAYEKLCKVVMAGGHMDGPEVIENALEHHQNGDKVATEQNKAAQAKAMQELRRGL